MVTRLVITADDLGIDPRRDDGILEAWRAGAITGASLLVEGPSAASAAKRAVAAGLPLGLHLDLTEMKPSADPAQVASLLGRDGRKRGKHGLRTALANGEVVPAHAALEARAQLASFERLTGSPARHVDGHQHVHTEPRLAAALAPALAAAGVRTTRIPHQRHGANGDFYRAVSTAASGARAVYEAAGITSTETFTGLDTMGAAMSVDGLRAVLDQLRGAASVELMCHPGHVGSGIDSFNESPDREHELRVLCQLPFAAQDWLRLVPFAELL